MERRLKESAYGYMEWLLNQYIHHTRRKVWEPLSEMFPMKIKAIDVDPEIKSSI